MACPFLPSLVPFLHRQPFVSRPCFIPSKAGSTVCPGWIDSLPVDSLLIHSTYPQVQISRHRSPIHGNHQSPALGQALDLQNHYVGKEPGVMVGLFFFLFSHFSNRELITPSPCTRPSPTSSTTPRWCSPTASPRPSTRPPWPRPAPTAWPWAWSLAPPWQCQQVRRENPSCALGAAQKNSRVLSQPCRVCIVQLLVLLAGYGSFAGRNAVIRPKS